MTDKELLKLAELEGTLRGLKAFTHCVTRAAQDGIADKTDHYRRGYCQARSDVAHSVAESLTEAIALLDAIRKEAQNV